MPRGPILQILPPTDSGETPVELWGGEGSFDRPGDNPPVHLNLHPTEVKLEVRGNGTFMLSWRDVFTSNIGAGFANPVERWIVRHVPLDFAGQPTGDVDWKRNLLNKSTYLDSTPSLGRGEILSCTHTDPFLQDGYILLVADVKLANGRLLVPSEPLLYQNNSGGGGGDAPIDPNSINSIGLSVEMNYQGRSDFAKITASYRAPADVSHFGGVQLYMKGYFGNPDLVEVGNLIRYTSKTGGGIASGSFVLERDPDLGSGRASVTNGVSTVTRVSGTSFETDGSWIARTIYVNGVEMEIHTVANANSLGADVWAGSSGTYDFRVRNPVTFYFVPVSKSGSRTNDPTSARSITIPGGIDAQFASIPAVTGLTVIQMGSTIGLEWDDPGGATDLARSIDAFVIWRADAGTQNSPTSPSQPAGKYDVKVREVDTDSASGTIRWMDRNFDLGDDGTRGDFQPGDPGRKRYWVAARDVRGQVSSVVDVYATLIGDQGNTADPGVPSRGSGFNMLQNGELRATVAGTYVGSGDTQKTPPTGYNNWESLLSFATEEPEWYSNGTAVSGTAPAGEVRYSRGLPLGVLEPSILIQRVPKVKVSIDTKVVISCELKASAGLAADDVFAIGWASFNGTGYVGGGNEGVFDSSVITTSYQRFWIYASIFDNGAGAYDHYGFYFTRNAYGGAASANYIYLTKPMVNDGTELAPWTSAMNTNDAPGNGSTPTGHPGGGDHFCLFAGTPILTPSGWRRVEDLEPGDEVLSFDGVGMVPSKVRANAQREAKNFAVIGNPPYQIVCTPSHRIGYKRAGGKLGYKEAGLFRPGDFLNIWKGEGALLEVPLRQLQGFMGEYYWDVFTITLDGPWRNYFANGILVHNKPIET